MGGGSVNSLPVSGLLVTPLYCRDLKEEKHLQRSERCASSWASAPSRSTCCCLSASAQGAPFSFLHAKPHPWNLGHADPSPGIPERWDKLPELEGTQLSTQPATQSSAGTVCLSLNSSCPSGVIIASQCKVGATTQSHHTDLPHRATMYSETESYITARRDQSRKAWARKEKGARRRGLLSLQVLTLILSLPGETMRR